MFLVKLYPWVKLTIKKNFFWYQNYYFWKILLTYLRDFFGSIHIYIYIYIAFTFTCLENWPKKWDLFHSAKIVANLHSNYLDSDGSGTRNWFSLVVREEYWQNRQKSERRRKVVSRSRQGFGNLLNILFRHGALPKPTSKT